MGKHWCIFLPDERKLVDTASLSKRNGFVLPLVVRNILHVSTGMILGYYLGPDGKIILATGGEKLLAAAKLSSGNAMVIPQPIAEQLHLQGPFEGQKRVGFYLEPNGKVSIEIIQLS